MRDYAMNRAEMAGSPDASLLAVFRNWLARRQLKKLAADDEASSEYSGITMADLQWAIRLPLDIDPRLALEDRLFHRARRLRAIATTGRRA